MNVFESFKYFTKELLRKYLEKYLLFQKLDFTMNGASVKVAILSFFLNFAAILGGKNLGHNIFKDHLILTNIFLFTEK